MPKIAYKSFRFSKDTLVVIDQANSIIEDYQASNLQLSLRQLYYQFVSRALIPNKDTEYKRLGSIINDARLAGLVDWYALEDRGRFLRGRQHWNSPAEIMRAVGSSYFKNMWDNQDYRPEVWIEKDALLGVIESVCTELDVPYFSCRGYTSATEMWSASQRLKRYADKGQTPVIFHLGDHDPSGIDMSRDIQDRLELFMGGTKFERLALNMDQVTQYDPPPNPAKITDSRSPTYIRIYGNESWELDALEPRVMADLIRNAVNGIRDMTKWEDRKAEIEREKATLAEASKRWSEVVTFLGGDGPTTPSPSTPVNPMTCAKCGETDWDDAEYIDEFECQWCSKVFCNSHIVLEDHDCPMDNRKEDEDEEE